MLTKNIYLIGFMGAGKSHVGRKLAAALEVPFIDMDAAIVEHENRSIKAIFEQDGQAYFRLIERRVLHDTRYLQPQIVATGGGAPCFFNNMEWMNANGVCIFLDASLSVLVERLWRGRDKRPLIAQQNEDTLPILIEDIMKKRRPFYEQAAIHYLIEHDQQETAEELRESLLQLIGH